jgi:hypothetical protein
MGAAAQSPCTLVTGLGSHPLIQIAQLAADRLGCPGLAPRYRRPRIADLERTLARLASAEEDIPQFWRDEAAQAVNRSRRFEAAAQ